jgi:16S rRNA (cytosine1402-N4)-methyltransferase
LYIDGTVGAGGHARGILDASAPDGRLLGLDVDAEALALARGNLAAYGPRVNLMHASYTSLPEAMQDAGWQGVDGIVLDLGVSSMQLDQPERGFSFQSDAPLDMRFDRSAGLRASTLLNTAAESELAGIFFRFGEERRAKKIARMVVAARPLETTQQLADLVKRVYPERSRIHPATRVFQALRIAVNDELDNLERALPRLVEALVRGGRLAVICFHSLEDRIVKQFFREQSRDQVNPPYEKIHETERKAALRVVTRKPIVPGAAEIRQNPRARSAKLRVAEKL